MARRIPLWLRRTLLIALFLLLAITVAGGGAWLYLHPTPQRTDGIVYGQRNGKNLTMDVFQPSNGNGKAVAFLVSGSWKSKPAGTVPVSTVAVFLRAGYSVFAVSHISQPEASVMEIIADVHRAIRFIRHHAMEYGVDPLKIGVVGGSAGGHLSLMLATTGGPGDAEAEDPVDRTSSAVQAVAIFFPATDLINLGSSTENLGDGGPPKSYRKAFGPDGAQPEVWQRVGRETSPIFHVHPNMPPILIHHGDADTLTPLDQSQRFQARAHEVGVEIPIVVRKGKGHGWPTMTLDIFDFVRWFNQHL